MTTRIRDSHIRGTLQEPEGPPRSEAELRGRCDRIAGRTLGELAAALGSEVPPDLRRKKGWVGMLLENALGASAGSRPVPDFQRLGIELKTLPIDARGLPQESTYVCSLQLVEHDELRWENSRARGKLARVLWVPVEADHGLPLAERRVGQPVIWSPDPDHEAALKADWEAHIEAVRQGVIDDVSAYEGRYLQVRPKAADSRQRVWARDCWGEYYLTLPRGFYLRTLFTQEILTRCYAG